MRVFESLKMEGLKKIKNFDRNIGVDFFIFILYVAENDGRRENVKSSEKMMAPLLQLQLNFLAKNRPKKVEFNPLFLYGIIFRPGYER